MNKTTAFATALATASLVACNTDHHTEDHTELDSLHRHRVKADQAFPKDTQMPARATTQERAAWADTVQRRTAVETGRPTLPNGESRKAIGRVLCNDGQRLFIQDMGSNALRVGALVGVDGQPLVGAGNLEKASDTLRIFTFDPAHPDRILSATPYGNGATLRQPQEALAIARGLAQEANGDNVQRGWKGIDTARRYSIPTLGLPERKFILATLETLSGNEMFLKDLHGRTLHMTMRGADGATLAADQLKEFPLGATYLIDRASKDVMQSMTLVQEPKPQKPVAGKNQPKDAVQKAQEAWGFKLQQWNATHDKLTQLDQFSNQASLQEEGRIRLVNRALGQGR